MKNETCPHCGGEFNSQKHRYTGGVGSLFKFRWPSEQVNDQFTVRCPHCGIAYVSDTVKFLGIVTRKTYTLFSFALILIVVCLVTLVGPYLRRMG
jgi:rRNA maturation protein Nop10